MAMLERFEMRMDRKVFERIDHWRSQQADVPSRSEAIRRLIEAALTPEDKSSVEISDGEKLILIMLGDVYKALKIDGEIDPAFVARTIYGGHNWALKWELSGVFHGHTDDYANVSEVVDIMDMWDFIESGYAKLSKSAKASIEKDADPFGKYVRFSGFDGNNESSHLSIARFLVDDLKRFSIFEGRDLNSYAPLLDSYRRMLRVFEPMRRTLVGGGLSAAQIVDLLKAKVHPESHQRQ